MLQFDWFTKNYKEYDCSAGNNVRFDHVSVSDTQTGKQEKT
jgi:hypothetical protein